MSSLPRFMRGAGWVAFALMWIPFTLMFLSMPDGNSDELTGNMFIFLASTIALSILAMGLIFGSMIVSWLLGRMVLSRGESGTARIINIQPTNVRVNRYYYGMRFTLEVQSFGETFQADAERLVPMHEMTKYQIGMMVNVKFDPATKIIAMVD